MACAWLPGSTQVKKILDVSLGATRGSIAYSIFNALHSFPLAWHQRVYLSPTAILNDLLFEIAVRSDRLCILVAGLLDAFVMVLIDEAGCRIVVVLIDNFV